MSASVATRRRSIYSETVIRKVVALDAVVNVLGAVVLFTGASVWESAFGLEATLPVIFLGMVFLVNGIECWMTARRGSMSSTSLWVLAGVDYAFALFALVVAAIDPTGADTWARWTLVTVADAALIVGAIKGYGAYRINRERPHYA